MTERGQNQEHGDLSNEDSAMSMLKACKRSCNPLETDLHKSFRGPASYVLLSCLFSACLTCFPSLVPSLPLPLWISITSLVPFLKKELISWILPSCSWLHLVSPTFFLYLLPVWEDDACTFVMQQECHPVHECSQEGKPLGFFPPAADWPFLSPIYHAFI